jgi:hypothetical protein
MPTRRGTLLASHQDHYETYEPVAGENRGGRDGGHGVGGREAPPSERRQRREPHASGHRAGRIRERGSVAQGDEHCPSDLTVVRERIAGLEVSAEIGALAPTQHVRHIGRDLRRQHRRPEYIERGRARHPGEDETLRDEEHHHEGNERDADPPVETAVPPRAHSHCRLVHTLDVAEVLRTVEKNQTSANV